VRRRRGKRLILTDPEVKEDEIGERPSIVGVFPEIPGGNDPLMPGGRWNREFGSFFLPRGSTRGADRGKGGVPGERPSESSVCAGPKKGSKLGKGN